MVIGRRARRRAESLRVPAVHPLCREGALRIPPQTPSENLFDRRRRLLRQHSPVRLFVGRPRACRTRSPPKALLPVSISYSTQPKAQTSVRLSTGLPRACSGHMYAAVPRTTPGRRGSRRERRGLRRGRPGAAFEIPSRRSSRDRSRGAYPPVGRDLDVGRFEVAVDDPLLVRRFQRLGDLLRVREGLFEWKRAGGRRCPGLLPRRAPSPGDGGKEGEEPGISSKE